MKANVLTTAIVSLFLFAMSTATIKAETNTLLYHNVEKSENIISTTYFKENYKNKSLAPHEKKVCVLGEQGERISKTTYIWNPYNSSWIPFEKMTYLYNNNTKLVNAHRYVWNNELKDWTSYQNISHRD